MVRAWPASRSVARLCPAPWLALDFYWRLRPALGQLQLDLAAVILVDGVFVALTNSPSPPHFASLFLISGLAPLYAIAFVLTITVTLLHSRSDIPAEHADKTPDNSRENLRGILAQRHGLMVYDLNKYCGHNENNGQP
jgi:hypothetical protein